MPVFFARGKAHDIAGMYLLNWPVPKLHPTTADCDNQGLAQRMRMSRRSCAWFEGYAGRAGAAWLDCVKKRINADRARKPF